MKPRYNLQISLNQAEYLEFLKILKSSGLTKASLIREAIKKYAKETRKND